MFSFKNTVLCAIAASTTMIAATPSYSAVTIFLPGDPGFSVVGDPGSGTVSADIGHSGIPVGDFTDIFRFTIDQDGFGSGSVTTSTSFLLGLTDLDFKSVTFNGDIIPITSFGGFVEIASGFLIPVANGVLNELIITGTGRGNGSYGGNVTFVPAPQVPEPASWALMIGGLGLVGMSLRRRALKVSFA